jgi:pimeloyl-ACP methyl ester carboxylesterase
MPGTVIYLHGAFDAGIAAAYATRACEEPDGAIATECRRHGFRLLHPVAQFNPLPINWNHDPLLRQVRQILNDGHGPYFLAGHSLGGRGALLIALRNAELRPRIRAVGAVAPALGEGIAALVTPHVPLPAGFPGLPLQLPAYDPFTVQDLQHELPASGLPAFIAYSPHDTVSGLQDQDMQPLHNPAQGQTIRRYAYGVPGINPHNHLVEHSADELINFFAGLP